MLVTEWTWVMFPNICYVFWVLKMERAMTIYCFSGNTPRNMPYIDNISLTYVPRPSLTSQADHHSWLDVAGIYTPRRHRSWFPGTSVTRQGGGARQSWRRLKKDWPTKSFLAVTPCHWIMMNKHAGNPGWAMWSFAFYGFVLQWGLFQL